MAQPRLPRLSLIAAIAANGVIGAGNALPWRLPEDLRRFRALTLGHPVIMGRKTFESIGRPLPGRRNIVITRNREYQAAGCEVMVSLADALDACRDAGDEIFVIGGAQIYAEALPLAQRLYLTELKAEYPGDARFPQLDRAAWRECARERGTGSGIAFEFAVYERA
ncbi:MAG: dihydrofolate reductase [Zoogloeaceae bacterium]|nr:dihydrofolate reductase [Zoogloeaceae bacterium]MCK6383288.1 dihydrofolate reductase [Rhodocyclaceae bacterium]